MTAHLWDRSALAAATQGDALGVWSGVSGISIDTREIKQGDLFIALKAKRDGHDFVAEALSKGAAAALVSRLPDGLGIDTPCIMVRDTLEGLIRLAGASRHRAQQLSAIAVTGSVGKTSAKEALATILSAQAPTQKHKGKNIELNNW